MATDKSKGGKNDAVHSTSTCPEKRPTLERLRQMSGKRSLAETVRSALQLYLIVQEELEGGKQIVFETKDGGEREKVRLLSF